MRCLACNKNLSDKESTRKYASTGTFVDLCDGCFSTVEDDIPHIEGHGDDHDHDTGERNGQETEE